MLYNSLPYSSEFIVVVVKYNLIVLTADFHVRLPSERANENSDYLPASHTYHLHVIKHEKLLYPEIHMVTAVNPRAHPVAPAEYIMATFRGAQIAVHIRLHSPARCLPRPPPTCRSRSAGGE